MFGLDYYEMLNDMVERVAVFLKEFTDMVMRSTLKDSYHGTKRLELKQDIVRICKRTIDRLEESDKEQGDVIDTRLFMNVRLDSLEASFRAMEKKVDRLEKLEKKAEKNDALLKDIIARNTIDRLGDK